MEEARQHSALTPEQQAFGVVFFAGHVALLGGIVAIIAGYGTGITIGVLGFTLSKIVLAVWALVRPNSQIEQRSNLSRFFVAFGWTAIAGLMIWVRMR